MSTLYMPKTLAKTLSYILYHSPGEYGLFWGPDGTMPWKELFWALQEDPSLRFVREMHMKEIAYLGIEIPVVLEEGVLKLKPDVPLPTYPVVALPPERLYYGCRRKHLLFVREHGLSPSMRPFLPLASQRELALRIARRRDPEPVLIEVEARRASAEGILFRKAGPELYLVESLPVDKFLCPPIREDETSRRASKGKKEKARARPEALSTPGSFIVSPDHVRVPSNEKGGTGKAKTKGKGGSDWKRQSRKERGKRTI